MNVSFNGFNETALTFKCADKITKLYPVKISDDSTVAKCNSGDQFIGFCLDSDNENAVVQMSGYVKTTYSDSAPALGRTKLVSDAAGSVKTGTSGVPCIVLAVNSTDSTVEFLF
ncbi:MAG: hypothetical protein IKL16_01840 [Clostridia bacterium]|nr:hypothetical protein [Clostridia bacterium]